MDDERLPVPYAKPVATALERDPVFRVLRLRLVRPEMLGIVIALLILAALVFGPSADSRFVYTDF